MPQESATKKVNSEANAKAEAKAEEIEVLAQEIRPLAQMFVAGFRASDQGLDAQQILHAFIGAVDKHNPKLGSSFEMPREASIQFIGAWKEFVDGSLL